MHWLTCPGVITMEPAGTTADAAQGGGAANRSPADETSASAIAESEASSDAASREAQADAETPAQSSAVSGSTGTSGNASLSEAAYEGEVKALVQQLYAVKGRAEGGLNACIASAKAEYKSPAAGAADPQPQNCHLHVQSRPALGPAGLLRQ